MFGPELHKVVDIRGNGATLLRLSDSKIFRRHLDDIKVATQVDEQTEMCWVDEDDVATAALPEDVRQAPPDMIGAGRPQRVRQPPRRHGYPEINEEEMV